MIISNYDILLSPVVTEKSTLLSEANKVIFKVALKSNKKQIKKSVEEIFKVKVKSVNTLRRKGKSTNFRNFKGKRKDFEFKSETTDLDDLADELFDALYDHTNK